MIKKYALIIVALFMFARVADSEPNSEVKWLMGDSVSTFTFGMYRLQLWLDERFSRERNPYTRVPPLTNYDWERNRIKIMWQVSGQRDSCRQRISNLRSDLFVDPETGKLKENYSIVGHTLIGTFFQQEGHKRLTEPPNLGSQLDKIVELEVRYDSPIAKQSGTCKGDLMSNEVFYSN